MVERLRQMLIKEFIQVLRDPRMRVVIFVIPCIQLLIIGYAVSTDVRNVATAVYDLDNSQESRELVARFVQSGYFQTTTYVHDDAELRDAIDRGVASVALHVRHGFAEQLRAGRTAALQIIVDGSDSNTATVVVGYSQKIAGEYSRQITVERFSRISGLRPPGQVELRVRAWFNQDLESRNFFVPGVIVIIVTVVTLLLTSMAVVREKEVGTMEQIMVTPITPLEFILGKTIPFGIIGLIDVTIVLVVGVFWFQVPLRGSVPLLLCGSVLYLLTMLGAGLLISTISRTQQQAMMTTFFFFFPAMLLSGFAFPIANMPETVQWLTLLNPLRYFLIIIRGVFLKGVGLGVLWPEMLALAMMSVLTIGAVARRFQKTA